MKYKHFELTENELQVLKTMWKYNRALSRTDLIELTENRTWQESSVHILINSLLEKGAVFIDGFERAGRTYGRLYSAALTKDEYDLMQLESEYSQLKPSAKATSIFVLNLIDSELEQEDIDKLKQLINSK